MFPLYVSYTHAKIWWYHVLDSVLLLVTNRSMRDACLESWFGPHTETNYCVYENFIKCLNISLCLSYMRHIFMLKLNYDMPLTWSCWWLQIGHKRHLSQVTIWPPRRYKLSCVWKFSSSIAHLINIMHVVYVKYDAQIIMCITSTTW
jgi:hypothetical protein